MKRSSVFEIGSRSRHRHSRNESARTEQEPKGLDELNHYEDKAEEKGWKGSLPSCQERRCGMRDLKEKGEGATGAPYMAKR